MSNWGVPDYNTSEVIDIKALHERIRKEDPNAIVCWPFQVAAGASPSLVRQFCVNDREWQDVRLSMKGKATHEKLAILQSWFHRLFASGETQRAMVQVVNYLGAVRRGGQLNEKNEIRKYR